MQTLSRYTSHPTGGVGEDGGGLKTKVFEKSGIVKKIVQKVTGPTQTKWAAPIELAPKKDGSLCLYVDYQKFNVVNKRDFYPTPCMDEGNVSFGKDVLGFTLAASSGYRQVKAEDTDHDKSAFTSHNDLYGILQVLFGLKNAPRTLQQATDVILSLVKWQCVLMYQDSVIVFSRSPRNHINHMRQVLSLLQDTTITLK